MKRLLIIVIAVAAIAITIAIAAFALRAKRAAFESLDDGLPVSGQWRNGFAVADMNGDGALDLVFSPARKGRRQPSIFLGDRNGAWKLWTEARYPPLPYDYGAVAVADFNGDGKKDIAFGAHLTGVGVITGDGAGQFTPLMAGLELRAGGPEPVAFSSRAVAATDWDNDGDQDLIALSDGPRRSKSAVQTGMRIYLNEGAQGFVLAAQPDSDDAFGDTLAVADIDGDGRPDALPGLNILGAPTPLRLGRGKSGWIAQPLDLPAPAIFRAGVAADFTGDARTDVVVSFSTNKNGAWQTGVLLFANENGAFVRASLSETHGLNEWFVLAAGDFDGDGKVDLAGARDDGSIAVFLRTGTLATLELALTIAAPESLKGCRVYGLSFANVDGKSGDELIASYAGEGGPNDCSSGGAIKVFRHR